MSGKGNQTKAVAFGGVLCGLAVGLMFLTNLFPMAEYSLPAIAGALMIAMVIEYGYKKALLCYLGVSALCLLLVSNKEPAVLFAFFFGYYPILKGKLEGCRNRFVEWLLKMLLFNGAVILSYLVLVSVFGLREVLEEFQNFQGWGLPLFLGLGNGVFVLFDFALTRLIWLYYNRIRPRLQGKLF